MSEAVQKLTAAMAAGEARAVEAFYRGYFEFMYGHARKITGRDEAFCLDVVQDAVIRVIRTVRPVQSEGQFCAWLRLVTQTCAYDLMKSESRRKRREAAVAVIGSDAESIDVATDDEIRDRLEWIRERIALLDPEIIRMIEMRFEKRWTLARVAEAMGVSIGTVDGRLRRALRELRNVVEGQS
ncbi:MAG TPA: sigma-70 family RNA polymerase sigma factor [Tepidisphaeraceae bacterium]|jgi:RNA polymerase sigma factor (sigma-70 family)